MTDGEPHAERIRAPTYALAIGAIFLVALGLRLWGAGFGLPVHEHQDEGLISTRALRMLETGKLNPRWFTYPTLYIYVNAAVMWLSGGFAGSGDPETYARWVGRITTAILGAATVLPVAGAARVLGGRVAAILAALSLAVFFVHAQHAHYLTTDVPAAFAVALCLWTAMRGLGDRGTRWLVASGAAAGLAAAMKYNAGLCVVMPVAAALSGAGTLRARLGLVAAIGFASLAVFIVAMPWIVLDTSRVIGSLLREMAHYRRGHMGSEGENNASFFLSYLWDSGLGPGLAVLALAGWIALARTSMRRWIVVSSFPILYFILITTVRTRFVRNLMPLMGPLAVLAGLGFTSTLAWLRGRSSSAVRVGGTFLLALVLVWSGLRIALYDHYLTRPDSRHEARAWLDEEHAGARTCLAHVALAPLPLPLRPHDLDESECDVVIVNSYMYEPFLADPEMDPATTELYRDAFARWKLLAEFSYTDSPFLQSMLGPSLGAHSPVVRIYQPDPSRPRTRPLSVAPGSRRRAAGSGS